MEKDYDAVVNVTLQNNKLQDSSFVEKDEEVVNVSINYSDKELFSNDELIINHFSSTSLYYIKYDWKSNSFKFATTEMDRVLVQVKSIYLSNGFDCEIIIKHAKVNNAKRKRSASKESNDNTKAIELVKEHKTALTTPSKCKLFEHDLISGYKANNSFQIFDSKIQNYYCYFYDFF